MSVRGFVQGGVPQVSPVLRDLGPVYLHRTPGDPRSSVTDSHPRADLGSSSCPETLCAITVRCHLHFLIASCYQRQGGVPHLSFFERWDATSLSRLGLWILRMLARSCISVGTGEDEKEARRCMSPRLATLAKNKSAKGGHPPRI